MHDCLNIVTEPAGSPAALLLRAIEPLEGIERMRASHAERKSIRRRTPSATRRIADARIAAGPGLVCAAFDLDRTLTGHDLFDPTGPVRLEPPPPGEASPSIVAGPRVGIAYAGAPWTDVPWRLSIAGHPSVSRPLPQRAG